MIPKFVLQYPLRNSFLLTQWIQMLNYQSNNWIILIILHQWIFRIVFIFTCFFCISNRNRKHRIFWSSLTLNIALRQPLVKMRFSCTEFFLLPPQYQDQTNASIFQTVLETMFKGFTGILFSIGILIGRDFGRSLLMNFYPPIYVNNSCLLFL